MSHLITIPVVALLFVLVRAIDLAISAAIGKAYVRAVAYGLVGLLALLVTLVVVFGLHIS